MMGMYFFISYMVSTRSVRSTGHCKNDLITTNTTELRDDNFSKIMMMSLTQVSICYRFTELYRTRFPLFSLSTVWKVALGSYEIGRTYPSATCAQHIQALAFVLSDE